MRCAAYRSLKTFSNDFGSSLVGFVLVAPLLVVVFIAVGQISIIVADKSVMNAAATIGARAASAADASTSSGYKAASSVLTSRGGNFQLSKISVSQERIAGVDYIQVTIRRDIEIQLINQSISLISTARSVDERLL